jgi:hypothetical protein
MQRFSGSGVALRIAAALLPLLLGGATTQTPAKPKVDLELVLAVDASGSLTDGRWDLERQGYAQAFRDPEVLRAIKSGVVGSIAVTLVEWSWLSEQAQVVQWTIINDSESADAFAAQLTKLPQLFGSRTSIANAIVFSAQLLFDAPFQTEGEIIDVSGDGPDNTSLGGSTANALDTSRLDQARDQVVATGITINGLPILGDPTVKNLDDYYRGHVIGGFGSFVVTAESYDTFAMAIHRKLVQEIADTNRGPSRAILAAAQ